MNDMNYSQWSAMTQAEREKYMRNAEGEWREYVRAHVPGKVLDNAESAAVHKGLGLYVLGLKGLGHRCGYVALPAGHPLFRVKYANPAMPDFDVHGGITFSTLIDGYWVLGWDAAHAGDAPDPELLRSSNDETRRIILGGIEGHVWTALEAFEETWRFAEQLADYGVRAGWKR